MTFNIKPLTDSGEDKLTGFQDIELSNISLFIDDATPGVPSCLLNCVNADLRGLDMSGQQLVSTFMRADFSPKGTTKTRLSGAKLFGANLFDANLTGADLAYTDLTGANMIGADLTDAVLFGARLGGADLLNANLIGADLTTATYDSTTTWPTAKWWGNTTCPDGTNSDNNPSCGF